MSTTMTPPAPAPAAPSAAPSAPAPSTATPSAPTPAAPSSAPASAPASPVVPTAEPGAPLSMDDRLAQGWEKAKANAAASLAEPAATETPAAPETTAAPEAAPTEEAGSDGAAKPAVEATAEATPEAAVEFDDGESVAPDAFAKELRADPAAQKFFDEHPEMKSRVFGALRRDSENREIRQYVPNVETAKLVTKAAADYQVLDNHFLGATSPEGVQQFLNHWIQEAMYLDDKGQPVLENGKYKLHPALTNTFDHIAGNKMAAYAQQIKESGKLPAQLGSIVDAIKSFAVTKGDERLQAVADVLREALSPSSPAEGEYPDELKPYAERLKAKEAELSEKEKADAGRQQQAQREAHIQSINQAQDTAAKSVQGQLKPLFSQSGLTAFEQEGALRQIGDAIDEALGHFDMESGKWTGGNHPSARMFQGTYRSILLNQAPGEAREKALSKHILSYVNEILGPIATKVVRSAKAGTLERQTERQTRVEAQRLSSQADPRGTSVTSPSPQNQTPAQLRAQIVSEYKTAHGGDDPDLAYVISEGAKRMKLFGQ